MAATERGAGQGAAARAARYVARVLLVALALLPLYLAVTAALQRARERPFYPTGGYVYQLAWSPDGTRLAVSERFDRTVGVLDLVRGKMLWQRDKEIFGEQAIAFSPDGRFVVTPPVSAERAYNGTALDLLDAASGKLVHEIPTLQTYHTAEGSIGRGFAFTADGRFLVVSPEYGLGDPVGIYSAKTWKAVRRISAARQMFSPIAVSRDGLLAADWWPQEIALFDIASGNLVRTFPTKSYLIMTRLAFSPDGRYLVSAAFSTDDSGAEPEPLRVYRVADGAMVRAQRVYSGWYTNALAWSADGRYIAWASAEAGAFLWDLERPDPAVRIRGLKGQCWAVAFSPDGRRLAIGTASGILVMPIGP